MNYIELTNPYFDFYLQNTRRYICNLIPAVDLSAQTLIVSKFGIISYRAFAISKEGQSEMTTVCVAAHQIGHRASINIIKWTQDPD